MWLVRLMVSMVVGAVLSLLLIAVLWSPSVRTRIFDGAAQVTAGWFGDPKPEEKRSAAGSGFFGMPGIEQVMGMLRANGERRMEIGRVYRLENGQRLAYLGNGRFGTAEAAPVRPPAVAASRSAPVPLAPESEVQAAGSE